MKLLSPIGCKKFPNRRPGRRPIGACSAKADAPGSITLPRRSVGSKFQHRERALLLDPRIAEAVPGTEPTFGYHGPHRSGAPSCPFRSVCDKLLSVGILNESSPMSLDSRMRRRVSLGFAVAKRRGEPAKTKGGGGDEAEFPRILGNGLVGPCNVRRCAGIRPKAGGCRQTVAFRQPGKHVDPRRIDRRC